MADEKYRFEGNTLIINDGVTTIEGTDFHTYYEDNGYEGVKDEKFQNVKKIVLPDSVTEIGYDAFYSFTSLKDISLPNSITNIGNYAFADCSSLESVIIPDSVTSIDWYAFMNCISLESITIPNSVTSIDEFAFWGCENLTIVCNKGSYAEEFAAEKGIPVEYIDEKKYHIEGDTLVINDGVTTIDKADFRYNDDDGEPYTFDEIKNIQHIIIPNSVKRIDDNAFHDCRELISITIPDSVTYIADNAFNEWTEFTIVCNEGSYAAKYAEENDISVDLIDERIYHIEGDTLIIDKGYEEIDERDFGWHKGLHWQAKKELEEIKKIIIPDGVRIIDTAAFSGFTNLTDISIPDTVKVIGDEVFNYCESLTNIVLPDTIKEISSYAFCNCKNLKSITLPSNITYIGEKTFENCKNLTSITIPNSVTEIGKEAFKDCENLESIIIPDSVTSIGEGAFKDCKNLKSITLPNNITYIGEKTFEGCKNLTSITIPDSVEDIYDFAFNGCTSLKSITIPNIVTDIRKFTFGSCESLESITIPERATDIYEDAFYGCSSLKSVSIPNGVTNINETAFENCKNLTISCNEGSYAAKYAKENNIPVEYVNDKKYHVEGDTLIVNDGVTAIDVDDFHYWEWDEGIPCVSNDIKDVRHIIVPESVKEIGSYSFGEFHNLKSIELPDTLDSVDTANLFSGSFRLEKVRIPNGVKTLEEWAFSGCRNLTIEVPYLSIEDIDGCAFNGIDNLTIKCVKGSYIAEYAKKYDIPVEFIDKKIYHIEGDTLIINEGIVAIDEDDFHFNDNGWSPIKQELKSIKKVIVSDSVTNIDEGTFYNLKTLENITIPNSVTTIGKAAFSCCCNLERVAIPNSVTSIGGFAFNSCINLKSITIPDSVASISDYTFINCKNLKSITIPDSVTSIGEDAFKDCENFTIKCNKGSYAAKYAEKHKIPIEYIGEHTKEQALSQIKDYINTLAEAMKHYDGKGDVGTYLEGYVGSSGADLGAFLSETNAAYIRNCFVSAYSGVNFNNTKDKSPIERYEARINSAVNKATNLAEELVNKSEKTSVEEIVDDVMHNEDFKKILKKELKAEIPENHKDDIISGKINEQDGNEIIGTDINTDCPVKEDCAVYIRDIKDTILENGAGTLTLDDFGDKHYNVQIESDSEIYTFKVSLPVSKTVGGVKVQGFKELGYIDTDKDEVGKTLKEIAENTAVVTSRKNGSKSLNEIFKDNKGKTLD